MEPITFNCRQCKKKTTGKILLEFTELLPPGLKVLECQEAKKNGICGILGVELIADTPSDLRL
jgi:hypothetical protein